MAKPRTFVSSTCYDLADARAAIADHLTSLGHEPLISDSSTFGVSFGKHSHEACLDQVDNCDYFVMIIGGRHGGTFVGSEKSITNEEYRRALKRKKPIMTFVRKNVEQVRQVYKKNPKADFTGVVDDPRVFDFIDLVSSQSEDNWIKQFDTVQDIKEALTSQFAYVALEYSKELIASRTPKTAEKDDRPVVPFPTHVTAIADTDDTAEAAATIHGLKGVHKVLAKIIKSAASGKNEKLKLLWVMGRYGDVNVNGTITMNNDRFKQYAWSTYKGTKVFNQIADFGVKGQYDLDSNGDVAAETAEIWFTDDPNGDVAHALNKYAADLIRRYGDDGIELFYKADMTIYS